MEARVRVERDEFVCCPGCSRTIAKISRDLRSGERIRAAHFVAVVGIPPIQGNAPAKCPDCGDFWFDGRRIHVDGRGWV